VNWIDWIAVAALGAIVGVSELTSRYRDAPEAALRTWPAFFYMATNMAASVAALGLMHANHWFEQARWSQILMAGITAMPSSARLSSWCAPETATLASAPAAFSRSS
jgi:hypothetical protein